MSDSKKLAVIGLSLLGATIWIMSLDWIQILGGLFLLLGSSVALSEVEHNSERAARPVTKGEHYLPFQEFPHQSGDNNGHTLVFLHGWPDDQALWLPYAEKLSHKYRCINCTLPGYPLPKDFKGDRGNMPERTWGYTIEEGADAFQTTIERTCSESKTVTLVGHDWGCVFGLMVLEQAPDTFQRVTLFDVGFTISPNLLQLIFFASYQTPLFIAHMLPERIGSLLTNRDAALLARTPAKDAEPVTNKMNWPYRSTFRDTLTNSGLKRLVAFNFSHIPVMFLQSSQFPEFLRFSDAEFRERVRQSHELSEVKVIEEKTHWFPNTRFDDTLQILDEFLTGTNDVISKA